MPAPAPVTSTTAFVKSSMGPEYTASVRGSGHVHHVAVAVHDPPYRLLAQIPAKLEAAHAEHWRIEDGHGHASPPARLRVTGTWQMRAASTVCPRASRPGGVALSPRTSTSRHGR